MRCEAIKMSLPEYIDRKLDEKMTGEINDHLESCQTCRQHHLELVYFLNFTGSFHDIEPPAGMKDEFLQLIGTEPSVHPKRMVPVSSWLKIAATLIFGLITSFAGYYWGSQKGIERQQQLEVVLNQTRQQVLLASLQDYSGSQRIEAVYTISQSGQSDDALINALVNRMNSDKNINVRLAAINALSGLIPKNQSVKNELIRSLSVQTNPLLQISLIQVLTESGVKEAKDEIESLSLNKNTDEKVKAFAKDMIKIII